MNSKQAQLDLLAPTFDLCCAGACIYKHCSLYSTYFICWELLLCVFFWLVRFSACLGYFGFCWSFFVGTCLVFFPLKDRSQQKRFCNTIKKTIKQKNPKQ